MLRSFLWIALCVCIVMGAPPLQMLAEEEDSTTSTTTSKLHADANEDTSTQQRLATSDFPSPDSAAMQHVPPATYNVRCETNVGSFVVAVTTAWAPIGSQRFYNLVVNNWFSFNYFFRVVKGFVVQFGLSGVPKMDQMYEVADIKDDPVTQSNLAGYVTFATAGKDTRTTQLFVNLGSNKFLDSQGFSPFGVIDSDGMATIAKINSQYAEQPDQNKIISEGNSYLYKNFPNLSYIKSCHVDSS